MCRRTVVFIAVMQVKSEVHVNTCMRVKTTYIWEVRALSCVRVNILQEGSVKTQLIPFAFRVIPINISSYL